MTGQPQSMTGAGSKAGETELGPLRVEVRSVNGRNLTIKLRLPQVCAGLEAAIEQRERARLGRGTETVVVERSEGTAALPDHQALLSVAGELRRLADELGLPPPTVADVLQAAGGGRAEPATSRPLPGRFAQLLDAALDELAAHRDSDGAGTVRAIADSLDEFAALCARVQARAPQLVDDYRNRLLQRVQEFVAANLPEPPPAADLVREVALFADRVDVAEEMQRLSAHSAELRSVLATGGEVGRRGEFLLQELLRETNTLGSKSPDADVAHAVVAMKSCIDRMKEQVANLA
jgi:uncharacterized protein (TIGR00255 family)